MAKIGILAVQGDFEKHQHIVNSLGHETLLVKTQDELFTSDALIIPGGESTTLTKLFAKHDLADALIQYAKVKPVFGTCAGLIVLSKESVNNSVNTLGIIDVTVARNAYGRQVDSFIDDIEINLKDQSFNFEGVFIRAPKIVQYGKDVKILGKHKNDIVLAQSGNVLVATFHPELTDDPRIHQYFIQQIKSKE
jgi:pyridoxal 5'-phosphate synthase pdxT subunit